MLSRDDIVKAIAEGSIKIYPFEEKNLTGIGYNLSTTWFAFSVNQGILLEICQETTVEGVKRFVTLPPNDTVLFFSKEYVEIDRTLAGTFHAKVSRVCQGLGHISTTLDPSWRGQLIISVNNPVSKEIPFDLDRDSGNIMTLLLHKLDTAVTGDNVHNNNQGRCDLLLKHFSNPVSNRKYRDRHLQLKAFVVGEFADSLNGYDNFLDSDQPVDKYSQKINQLRELRNRLARDRIIILENRYNLGEHGKYNCLQTNSEETLIRGCRLFKIEQMQETPLKLISSFQKGNLTEATKMIEEYIRIIDYELDTINHLRRIQWQNKKIEEFAGETSPLIRLRRHEERKKLALRFCLPSLLFLVACVILAKMILSNDESLTAGTILAILFAPVPAFLLQWWQQTRNSISTDIKKASKKK